MSGKSLILTWQEWVSHPDGQVSKMDINNTVLIFPL